MVVVVPAIAVVRVRKCRCEGNVERHWRRERIMEWWLRGRRGPLPESMGLIWRGGLCLLLCEPAGAGMLLAAYGASGFLLLTLLGVGRVQFGGRDKWRITFRSDALTSNGRIIGCL